MVEHWPHCMTPMERLSEHDRAIVQDCLGATVEGPFFPDWEFRTLFGLTRDQVRHVLETWPETTDLEVQDVAVNNALNNLIGYPHSNWAAWREFTSVGPEEVARILNSWRGHDAYDESAKGYFERLQ